MVNNKSMMGRHLQGKMRACRARFLFLLLVLLLPVACDKDQFHDPGPPKQPEEIGKAQVWMTTGDQMKLLAKGSDIAITETTETSLTTIVIDPAKKFQEVEGFGAALTGSSAWLINTKLTTAQRASLLDELFDPGKGIGISYLRMTIGASDFSLSDYTYDDMPPGENDFDLAHFSIEKDRQDVVPVLKRIIGIAPDLRIMGSPWSAPAWMKTSGSLKGGKLKPEAYGVYARYFVKYIEAFAAEGIDIAAVTPQNEPLHFTASYPCMEMQAAAQSDFIANHLGPAFEEADIETDIVVYDHNWDNTQYALSILGDPEASRYVAGSAFHAYAGNVSAMSVVHAAQPDKGLYFTEISGGEWATNFGDNLQWNMANIFVGTMRNWSKNALLWNLALDENHGPTNNGCQDCRGVVTINAASGAVTRNVEYYAIGHLSKFVRPGAVRISSEATEAANLHHVAFVSPDERRILVVSNAAAASATFVVKCEGAQFTYSLPAKSVATIVWE